jgi:hypothetical protein
MEPQAQHNAIAENSSINREHQMSPIVGRTRKNLIALVLLSGSALAPTAWAQSTVSPELSDLVKKDLTAGQQKMQSQGWEFVHSLAIKQEQYWWNEGSKTCVSLKIKAKQIDGFKVIANKECESRVAKTRKRWESFAEGPATAKSASLDAGRAKLSGEGMKVVYWYRGTPDDISLEYWASADGKTCKSLAFQNSDGKLEAVLKQSPKKCVYPVQARKK